MRLLGSFQAVAYTHRRIPTAARAPASGRKGLPGVRIVQTRKRELAIVISTVGWREREETFPWRTSDDETRGEAEERQRMRSERESEGDREREGEENIVVAMVIWPHPMEPANELSTDRRPT